jgi:hypothetical protein
MRKYIIILPCIALSFFAAHDVRVEASGTASVRIQIISLCGNGVIDPGEQCDGSNLAGRTCSSSGYAGGTLGCSASCILDASRCTPVQTPPAGGGGGGGSAPSVITQVTFAGKAYPLSAVSILKDGQLAIKTIAGSDAAFSAALTGVSAGNHNFSVYSEDAQGRRSALFAFPVTVTYGASTNVSGIFLAPTIDVDKAEVKRGDTVTIFGQTAPNSSVTISVNSDEEFFGTAKADKDGVYAYNFDTSVLEMGQHSAKSKAMLQKDFSSFGQSVGFAVGTRNVARKSGKALRGDLNGDGRVNLVDFSIAAYWYKRKPSAEFVKLEAERLSGDGKVDLVDFSVMAFYWTG